MLHDDMEFEIDPELVEFEEVDVTEPPCGSEEDPRAVKPDSFGPSPCGKPCRCMLPSQFASKLRQIAAAIDNFDQPSASSVIREVFAAVGEMELSQPVPAEPIGWGHGDVKVVNSPTTMLEEPEEFCECDSEF
jgi:hypothetical protein